jgi:hypothetical protein
MPTDDHADVTHTLTTASRNLVAACAGPRIQRLVVLTVAGIDDPGSMGIPWRVEQPTSRKKQSPKHVNSARGRIQVTALLRSRSRFLKNTSASLRLLSIGRLVCSFA